MVCSLLGTPYFPHVRGGILFLEDVNEPAYRIERLLLQLLQAGVLARQKAILLGDFSGVALLPTDNGYDLAAVWEAIRARCPVPIITGLPLGHGQRRAMLAVGAPARIRVAREASGAAAAPAGVTVHLQFCGHPTVRQTSQRAARRPENRAHKLSA